MSKKNGISFNYLDIKDFLQNFKRIKTDILLKNSINVDLEEKDLQKFVFIIKNFGYNFIYNIKYLSKENLAFILNKNLSKRFFINNISLLFMFLFCENKICKISKEEDIIIYEKNFKKTYKNLFRLIDNITNINKNKNYILEIGDVYEIIRLNCFLGLDDLWNKSFIFNESIHYLNKIFISNENNPNSLSSVKSILSQIYTNIVKSEKNLHFIKTDKNLDNFAILEITNFLSSSQIDLKLNDLILELLDLIYKNNYSSLVSDYFLNLIKEGFFELKENNSTKIIRCIKNICGLMKFLNILFLQEENDKKDVYHPSSYFVFGGSEFSGIDYNPSNELLRTSFTLIFSFRITKVKDDIIYPLISFVTHGQKNEIMLNISIQNGKLQLYCQGEKKLKEIESVYTNKSYMIIVEYKKGTFKDKIKIYINDIKSHEFNTGNINNKAICSLQIGYLSLKNATNTDKVFTNIEKFQGIIGPIIQFSNIFEDKNFIPNVFNLKGKYNLMLLMDNTVNLDYYDYYEEYHSSVEISFSSVKKYFIEISDKLNKNFQYSICPESIINNINKDTFYFCQDIYNKSSKKLSKDIFPDFHTLNIPSSKSLATYAQKNQRSLSAFVEYDGISIYTLIVEYFYNILRMLINNPNEEKMDLANEMYKVLILIIRGIFQILKFFKLELIINDIDTFGFSIKKLLSLLVDIQPLSEQFIKELVDQGKTIISYSEELNNNSTKIIIYNFFWKLISLIFSPKFLTISNYSNTEQLFKFIYQLVKNNNDLINENILNKIMEFYFILDPISFDINGNKPKGTTTSSNKEYKNMKKEYKNLLSIFIQNSNSLKLYITFLQNVFGNKNSRWVEKNELMKIYYKFHNVQCFYSDKDIKDLNKLPSNFLKREKNNKMSDFSEKDILKEYQSYFLKLIDVSEPKEEDDKNSLEMLKAILIMLIYEHKIIIPLNIINENNEASNIKFKRAEKRRSTIKIEDYNIEDTTFFSSFSFGKRKSQSNSLRKDSLNSAYIGNKYSKLDESERNYSDFSMEEKDVSSQSSESLEFKVNNISNKKNYLFDSFLNSKDFSLYTIKGFFMCLCDKLDKKSKIRFIKNDKDNFDSFKNYIGKYDRYKKELFSQLLCLIECLHNENILEKSLKLIFSFIKYSIVRYTSDNSDKESKSLFYHLFESKTIFNHFFIFCLNDEIITNKEFKDYIIDSIKYINKNILIYHPKPFIFSFIKCCIKLEFSETFLLIEDIFKTIIEELKSKTYAQLNLILYQNFIRFIKTLGNASEKYSDNVSKLLVENNFELFYCIQNFIKEISDSDFIYDPNLYVVSPCYSQQIKDEKKDAKIFQSPKTKLLNNQIIYLIIFQLALNCVYLLLKSYEQEKEAVNVSLEYVLKIFDEMVLNQEYFIFYLDLINPFFQINNKGSYHIPEKITKIINQDMKSFSKLKHNLFTRESRIVTFSLFLIIMKCKFLLINYTKSKICDKTTESLIHTQFDPLINLIEDEITFLIANISKVKENKNMEILIEKEENKSAEFKNFNRNYYKYFSEKLRSKNNTIQSIIDEIEQKVNMEEFQKQRLSLKSINNDNSISYNESKAEKKEKQRKDSFGEYNEENDLVDGKNVMNKHKEESKSNLELPKININKENYPLDFENTKRPILCTKRDIILKNFGFFYYKYYFKNNKFIKLRKLFFYNNNPKIKINNYHGYQKTMKNKYPFTTKNFNNYHSYYPRVFFRPYHKLFKDKNFGVTHSYFKKDEYDKTNNEKVLHLEYGHGLLNQPNFDLFTLSKKGESTNVISCSSFGNENEEEINIFNLGTIVENVEKNNMLWFSETLFPKNDNNITNFFMNRQMTVNQRLSKYRSNLANNSNKENINKIKFECEKISTKNISNGALYFTDNFLIYQANTKFDKSEYITNHKYLFSSSEYELAQEEKQIIFCYSSISHVLYRKYIFYGIAIEIFLYNGKSYYFNFYTYKNKNNFMNALRERIKEEKIIINSIEHFEKKKYTNKFLEGKISTLDYLLLINKHADRSYNVLTQYLILPWLLSNYENINDPESLRNFSFSPTIKTKEDLEKIVMENEWDGNQSCYSNFFSNYMYVNHYLFRLFPFINNQIKLQDGKLEEPGRQFSSIITTFKVFQENPHINIELVPEFYFIPELFLNINYCYYGKFNYLNQKFLINNLGIGPNFDYILEIINYHQTNLNSENIISQINKWIDYAFGEKQISFKKDSVNFFPRECYGKLVKEYFDEKCQEIQSILQNKYKGEISNIKTTKIENKEKDLTSIIKETIQQIKETINKSYFYGQCPTQLFTKSHPSFTKKIEPKIYNLSNKNNLQIILRNALLVIDCKDILYMQESSNGNYFYLIYEHEIKVYNKNFKLMNNLSINNISKIPNCFSTKYHTNTKFFKSINNYKYIIFDILDCKYFFIGGYIDNSLRIYYKEKDKDIMYSYYMNSQIKCLRNNSFNQTFFSGHENGKLVKWSYIINNDYNQINIVKGNSVRGHRSPVKMIELNEKYGCILSVDEEEIVSVRKMYDFELLSYIKLNKYHKKVIDINVCNQVIILTIFKNQTNQIFINTYSLNGLNLGQIISQLRLPITLISNTDEIILFTSGNIYVTKIAFNEKTSLSPFSSNLDINDVGCNLEEEEDIDDKFNIDLQSNDAISYFYDCKNRVLFCLFTDGKIYRINCVKNA